MMDYRTSGRFSCSRPVKYQVLGASGHPPAPAGAVVQGRLQDLGSGGLGMQTQGLRLEEGAVVQAWIPVADAPAAVPVLAEVRWVREARDEKSGAALAGLRFVV